MPEARSTSDTAFLDCGLTNDQVLVPATYYALSGRDEGTSDRTPGDDHRVADASRTAFVPRVSVPFVLEPADAAVEDAVTATTHELTREADLRTAVLPAFRCRVAADT